VTSVSVFEAAIR